FSSRRRHTRFDCDWSSDVCSSDLLASRDEVGRLASGVNAMIGRIQSVVRQVRESILQVLATASQTATTSQQQETTVQKLGSSTRSEERRVGKEGRTGGSGE